MKDIFYKNLLEASPFGYAYHRILCDQGGIPIDYEYLEMNPAFEDLTGLKASESIGLKRSGIIREQAESLAFWAKTYGEIALHGGSRTFDHYSDPFQRYFRVFVYSPEKYFFAVLLTDISKEIEDNQEKITILTALNDIVFELDENFVFINVFAADDTHLFINHQLIVGNSISQLLPAELAEHLIHSIVSFAPNCTNYSLRSVKALQTRALRLRFN